MKADDGFEVVRLSAQDERLLRERAQRFGNSFRRASVALREAGEHEARERLVALRRLERALDIDLAELCVRLARVGDPATHPLERRLLRAVASWRDGDAGAELWIFPERVRMLRDVTDADTVRDG